MNKLSVSFKQKIIETTMVDLGCKGLLSLYSQAKAIRVKMVVVVVVVVELQVCFNPKKVIYGVPM